ncbi:MAG: metal-sensitive transcriptional regulator [Peptococcaceae bacterium]|jgi:DNA-binding FrmR family transcriptional regulator|nr:metal-sensitive transcriptional regulator [Peptococcaceae bacterium]MDH7525139.1 metal-sensitive transcriptional regulator [Peptococcaceae bacterium]
MEESIKRRLRRIEGQLRGIQRMIDEDACCMDILVQISAIRAAVSKVGIMIFENHAKKCLSNGLKGDAKEREALLADLMSVMSNFIK